MNDDVIGTVIENKDENYQASRKELNELIVEVSLDLGKCNDVTNVNNNINLGMLLQFLSGVYYFYDTLKYEPKYKLVKVIHKSALRDVYFEFCRRGYFKLNLNNHFNILYIFKCYQRIFGIKLIEEIKNGK